MEFPGFPFIDISRTVPSLLTSMAVFQGHVPLFISLHREGPGLTRKQYENFSQSSLLGNFSCDTLHLRGGICDSVTIGNEQGPSGQKPTLHHLLGSALPCGSLTERSSHPRHSLHGQPDCLGVSHLLRIVAGLEDRRMVLCATET